MKIVGVTAEYNPFHSGHAYHLTQIRKEYGPDTGVVVVLSGDFVQRGEAAVLDKFTRAELALTGGADLVIENPLPWCMSSAQTFARGSVGLLKSLNLVDIISFGSESGDKEELMNASNLLLDDEVNISIKENLSKGMSYASACDKAISGHNILLCNPNDILGIEYMKEAKRLGWNGDFFPVKRNGCIHDGVGSAADIRMQWEKGMNVPENLTPVFSENLRIPAISRLRTLTLSDFASLPDASEGIENLLYKAAQTESSPELIAQYAKSKRYTLARLRRMTWSAVLGIQSIMTEGIPPYIRPLAFNACGKKILRQAKKTAELPIILKTAQVRKLDTRAEEIFDLTSKAHDFYVLGYKSLEKQVGGQDYLFTPREA